jgi:glucan biosynthesis protein C
MNPIISKQRMHYIDWVRHICLILLILGHSATIFDIRGDVYYVSSLTPSYPLTFLISFLETFLMATYFFLSGVSLYFDTKKKTFKQYIKTRFQRIGLPLLFGLLIIIPPESYLGAVWHGEYIGTYLDYYPQAFQIHESGSLDGYLGGFTPGHLWFLLALLIYMFPSLLFVAIFKNMKNETKEKIGNIMAKPGMIYIPLVFLALTFPETLDTGIPLFYYFVIVLLGFFFMIDKKIMESVEKHRCISLFIGLCSLFASKLFSGRGLVRIKDYSFFTILDFSIGTWFMVLGIVGFARIYLNKESKFSTYMNDANYPIFIIHQTIVVAVGYVVAQSTFAVWLQFVLIASLSMVLSVILYDIVIRDSPALRYLMGMPKNKR